MISVDYGGGQFKRPATNGRINEIIPEESMTFLYTQDSRKGKVSIGLRSCQDTSCYEPLLMENILKRLSSGTT